MAKTSEQERARKKRWRDKNKDRIREYNEEYNLEYRKAHPEKYREYRKRYYQKKKELLWDRKADLPCAHCGNKFHPVAMDWHHVDPNQKEFSIQALWNVGREKLLKELDKCILLCACCHRIHHYAASDIPHPLDS